MTMIAGVALVAITVTMIYLAKPSDGFGAVSKGMDCGADVRDGRAGECGLRHRTAGFELAALIELSGEAERWNRLQ
jgi:hypothetical protein